MSIGDVLNSLLEGSKVRAVIEIELDKYHTFEAISHLIDMGARFERMDDFVDCKIHLDEGTEAIDETEEIEEIEKIEDQIDEDHEELDKLPNIGTVQALLNAGRDVEFIASDTRTSVEAVNKVAARCRKIDHDEIYKLYSDGMRVKQIADQFGITQSSVYYIINKRKGYEK